MSWPSFSQSPLTPIFGKQAISLHSSNFSNLRRLEFRDWRLLQSSKKSGRPRDQPEPSQTPRPGSPRRTPEERQPGDPQVERRAPATRAARLDEHRDVSPAGGVEAGSLTDCLLEAKEVAEFLSVPVGWVHEHTPDGVDPARAARSVHPLRRRRGPRLGRVAQDGRRPDVQEAQTKVDCLMSCKRGDTSGRRVPPSRERADSSG